MTLLLQNYAPKEDRAAIAALLRVERFWSYVRTSPHLDNCWPWQGGVDSKGYGVFSERGEAVRAHRTAYMLAYGPIPDGLDINHLCHSAHPTCLGGPTCAHRRCVRPSHLEPISRGDNVRLAVRQISEAAKRRWEIQTHCRHGHELTAENTGRRPGGARFCRQCHREHNARSRTKGEEQR